ncbi:MAG TPA: DinB family protein, partial [Thermoanaerobaculia bacterium]|nr:DinB family protein [Thermoanaerobaculia bacterium]
SHVNDTERVFVSRAFWFARGFDSPLPSFDQDISAAAARADEVSWASHVEEFRAIRLATLAFFRNLQGEAWSRSGIASGNPFSVRALAYITAGHTSHHAAILRERYLLP